MSIDIIPKCYFHKIMNTVVKSNHFEQDKPNNWKPTLSTL